jgi:hypothetical protein
MDMVIFSIFISFPSILLYSCFGRSKWLVSYYFFTKIQPRWCSFYIYFLQFFPNLEKKIKQSIFYEPAKPGWTGFVWFLKNWPASFFNPWWFLFPVLRSFSDLIFYCFPFFISSFLSSYLLISYSDASVVTLWVLRLTRPVSWMCL